MGSKSNMLLLLILISLTTIYSCQKILYGIPDKEFLEISSPTLDTLSIYDQKFSTLPLSLSKDSTFWGIWCFETINQIRLYYSEDSLLKYKIFQKNTQNNYVYTFNSHPALMKVEIIKIDSHYFWYSKFYDQYYCISAIDNSIYILDDAKDTDDKMLVGKRVQSVEEENDRIAAYQTYCQKNDVGTIARWSDGTTYDRLYKEGNRYRVLHYSDGFEPEISTVRLRKQGDFVYFDDGTQLFNEKRIGFKIGDTSQLFTYVIDEETEEFSVEPHTVSTRIPLGEYRYHTVTDSVFLGKGFKWNPTK